MKVIKLMLRFLIALFFLALGSFGLVYNLLDMTIEKALVISAVITLGVAFLPSKEEVKRAFRGGEKGERD